MPIQHVSREKQLFKRTGFNSILTALCCCNFPLSTGTAAPSSLSPGNEQHQNLKGWCKPSLCGTKVTWYTFCAAAQRLRPNLIGGKKKKKDLVQSELLFLRKLKKLFRKLKDERTEPKEMDTNQSKDPQQWDLDYILEPFTGLTPEYMEMSKFSDFPFPFCNNHRLTEDQSWYIWLYVINWLDKGGKNPKHL